MAPARDGDISRRGVAFSADGSLLMTGMARVIENPYDPVRSPDGILNLGTAENKMMVDELVARVNTPGFGDIGPSDAMYGDFTGEPAVRAALARFLSRKMGAQLDPACFALLNGCGSVVEALSMVLCDPGDALLIFTPYYGGFDVDCSKRPGVTLFPVHLDASNGYALPPGALDDALARARAEGLNVRGLLLATPNNPLGRTYAPAELQEMLDFCHAHQLHCISDEIYFLSDFSKESGRPECEAVSVLTLRVPDPDRLHMVWGFSKDFGASGFRAGLLYTRNTAVLRAISTLSYFYGVPRPLQVILQRLVEDDEWVDTYLATNRKRLADALSHIRGHLQEMGVPFVECTVGMFIWVDLRAFLPRFGPAKSREAERALWNAFLANGLYIALGEAFHCREPGWFRIIFAAPQSTVNLAMTRMARTLGVAPRQ